VDGLKIVKLDEAEIFYPPQHYGVVDKVLVGKKTGAEFDLLYGFLAPGGCAETHTHDVGQAFFVLKGEITFAANGKKSVAGPNTAAYIPPSEAHSLMNDGKEMAEILVFLPAGKQAP
jgi:quercetin dioxygenase-like cupin family protein